MTPDLTSLPPLLQEYFAGSGFWAGAAEFDFWYAQTTEEWFWIHVRRKDQVTLGVALFCSDGGQIDLDLYNFTRAPVHGLRATFVNTPLMTLARYEPPQPIVAIRLRDGRSHHITVAQSAESLADQWLDDALTRLLGALEERWQLFHFSWRGSAAELLERWPDWAGPAPELHNS